MPRYEDGKGPPPPEDKGYVSIPWTLRECLPPFATYEIPELPMTKNEAALLLEHYDALPEWARGLAPIEQARKVNG